MTRKLFSCFVGCTAFLCVFLSCAGVKVVDTGVEAGETELFEKIKPVFIVPAADIKKGNGIEAVFFDQRGTEDGAVLEITVVFYDEDHPSALTDGLYDFYRSLKYRRVRDVETFFFHYNILGVERSRIDFPGTYAEDQAFYKKGVEHFSAEVPAARFEYAGSRPVIYVTTWNHLFRESAVEQDLETLTVDDYPVYPGSRAEVESLIAR
ncbi:MAG: hypothetical protein JW760_05165 [Spirochaetales bacterium]|nr:hypothetical protein [Spirochaetales bacterium]